MIRYRLQCAKGHEFEAWFSNGAAFDKQVKRGLLQCPDCGSTKVTKTLMAPSVATKGNRRGDAVLAETLSNAVPAEAAARIALQREVLATMRRVRDEVLSKAEHVGDRFAEEARKIHYEEAQARGIYGQATADEAQALREEGIEFHPLPRLPDDQN